MNIQEIKKEYLNGDKYKKPKNQLKYYPDDYVFDENLSVKENREMIRKANEEYLENGRICELKAIDNMRQFHNDIVEYIEEEYGFNYTQAVAIEARLWYENTSDIVYFFEEIDNFSYWLSEFVGLK